MHTHLSFLFRSPRLIFALQTALAFSLLAAGCSDPASEITARECTLDAQCANGERCSISSAVPGSGRCISDNGGGGAGGAPDQECVTDQDCWEQPEYSQGFACNRQGECFECDHEDPFSGPVETPEFWDPDQFTSGEELGLDPQLAYWELQLAEYGLAVQPTPDVWVCNRAIVEGGEIVDPGSGCDSLDAMDFIHTGASLIVPVAPSAWLSSEPLDGFYYAEVRFEFGPIYFCD